jgi:hypothetical protein
MGQESVIQKVEMNLALVSSDFHDCSEENLFQLAKIGNSFSCNIHFNAGDTPDKFLGHPAFDQFQNYFLLTEMNRSQDPGEYNLPENWHLLTEGIEVGDKKIPANNFLHFKYWLETKRPGIDSGYRMYSVVMVHDPGRGNLLKTTIDSIMSQQERNCYFWKMAEDAKRRAEKIAEEHRSHGLEEDVWVNALIFGHWHHWIGFGLEGVKNFNPGSWGGDLPGKDRMCFSIIIPGPLFKIQASLSENFNQVVEATYPARKLKEAIKV